MCAEPVERAPHLLEQIHRAESTAENGSPGLPTNYVWATLNAQSSRTFTVQAWADSSLGAGVYTGTVWIDDRDPSKRGHGGWAPLVAVIR